VLKLVILILLNWFSQNSDHINALKECHPRCVYQIYNRLIINNGSQKHNYICKFNNLPTTCFGLIRPSSGWNTASEENYLFDLNVDLDQIDHFPQMLYSNLKMAELGRNM